MKKKVIFLLCIIYIAFVCFTMIYPFDNVSLNVKFVLNTEHDLAKTEISVYEQKPDETSVVMENVVLNADNFEMELSNLDIKENHTYCVEIISEAASRNIDKIVIFRNNLEVKQIESGDFYANYLETYNQVEYAEGLYIEKMYTNDLLYSLLNNLSASLLMERIIIVIGLTSILAAGLIVIDLFLYERRNKNNKKILARFFSDIRSYAYFIVYSAKTDLKAEVANSYLNWVWWILEDSYPQLPLPTTPYV